MKINDFFAQNPVFRIEEFYQWRKSFSQATKAANNTLLNYHVRAKRLLRVKRGLYATVPFGFNSETISIAPYLIASKMTGDAILAYHSALQIQGKAYSLHNRFPFLTKKSIRPIKFQGMHFTGVSFPKALSDSGQESFGVEICRYAGGTAAITNLERTVVDLLARPRLGGGVEEIWRSAGLFGFLDLDQVVEYTLMLKNATIAAKVGFFLEYYQEEFMVEEQHLKTLERHIPRSPHYIKRNRRKHKKLIRRWNLIVPNVLLEQSKEICI